MAFIIHATGPTADRTYTFPDADAILLTDHDAITVAQGGTGIVSYTVGDLLYASAAGTLSKLPDVAVGSVLVSGGVGVAPAWSANPTLTSLTLGANPAAVGTVKLGNNSYLSARNQANSADVFLIGLNTSNQILLGGVTVVSGNLTADSYTISAGNIFQWVAGAKLFSPSDGQLVLWTQGQNDFDRLQFGGSTASFPALKRDTIFLRLRLADNSGVSGAVTASLPAAAAGRDGLIGFDTTLNAFVYYVGGARFKVVGTSF
jgi:hypothetical protein